MAGRRLRQPEAIAAAAKDGEAFEVAISAGNVPPPGYLWVNKFLVGDPAEWLPGLPHAASTLREPFDTAAWLTRTANEVKAREGLGGKAPEVELLWRSYTTGLAGTLFSATYEFLDEQSQLAERLDGLIAAQPALAVTKPWFPDTELHTTVLAESVRAGLAAKEVVFARGKYLGTDGAAEFRWDADLPSKTLGAFWMLLEQECNNYLQIPKYGLFATS